MIIANFINKQDALVTGLDQYDYGQVLRIQGLKLPTAIEIHFDLEETGGTTTTRIGVTKDGVTDVPIPDSMLENGDTSLDYTIYAFIYLTDETSGKTVHRIKIQVKARSKPELLNKPEDKELFKQAIEAVNQSAKEAEGWAHGREDMPERAEDNAKYYSEQASGSAEEVKKVEQSVKDMVATVDGIEQQVQDVKEYAGQAQSASEKALLSEQESKKSEEASLQHRTGAETAENNAELAESNAKKSEQAVEQAKQLVMQMGQEVLQNKNQVDGKVEAFNKVVTDAVDAIETVKTDAVNAVRTKGAEQTKKVTDEGAKQVKAVEDKGNEVLQSIPEDFTTQMASKLDKQQGAENKGKALVVGNDGNVTVGEVQGGDGIPIINTMSGESPLVISDSAERINKGFSIIGNTEQLTTTGANLFDISKISSVNVAVGKDVIIVKEYASNAIITAEQFMEMTGLKPGDSFTISYAFEGTITGSTGGTAFLGSSKSINFMGGGQTGSLKNTVVLPSDFGSEYGTLYFYGNKEGENCYIKNFMINKGNTAKPYEPYTGGKPSPSPEYPQEIKNVGKWNEEKQKYEVDVRVTGKNLLNQELLKDESNFDKTILPQGYWQYFIYLNPNTKYTVSRKNKDGYQTGKSIKISTVKNSTSGQLLMATHSASENRQSVTLTTPDTGLISINFLVKDINGVNETLKIAGYLQIECGEMASDFELYKEQTLTLTSDRPITKWDKLVEQDGQIGWLYQSAVKEYRGDTVVKPYSTGFYFLLNNKNIKEGEGYCSELIGYTSDRLSPCINFNMSPNSYAYTLSTQTIYGSTENEIKEYLKLHPLHLVYKTETTEFIPLPQSEQNAIRVLKTYYPTTVITTDGGEVDPDIEVTYIADTKNYIDQKIAPVIKSVVETQKALL